MVFRVFVEKREAVANEARALLSEIKTFLGISSVEKIWIFNRYDVEGISQELFEQCVPTVFSEPQSDDTFRELPEFAKSAKVFAVEFCSPTILTKELEVHACQLLTISEGYLVNILTHLGHGDAVQERCTPVGVVLR